MTHLQSTNKSVDYPTQMIGRNQIVKHYRKQCALTSPLTLNETHKNALAHHEGIFPLLNRSTQTFVTAWCCPGFCCWVSCGGRLVGDGEGDCCGVGCGAARAGDGDGLAASHGSAADGDGHGGAACASDGGGTEADRVEKSLAGGRERDGRVEAAGNRRGDGDLA